MDSGIGIGLDLSGGTEKESKDINVKLPSSNKNFENKPLAYFISY